MSNEMYLIDDAARALLFTEARTANTFDDTPVSDEQIAAVYDLVRFGPTTMNTQPFRMVLARSDDARQRVLGHLLPGNRAKAESAPLIAVFAVDLDFHDRLVDTFPHFAGARDVFADDAFRERTSYHQGWLQAGYVIVGLRSIGLAAGPMLGYDAAGLDADLFADSRWRSLMVVNIGRPGPDAWQERLPRLAYDEVVRSI